MNLKKYLEKRIRGWLPKEPNLPSFHRATNRKNVQSHKIKFPIVMVLLLSLWITMSIAEFFEGNATGALFLWLSCIIGLSLALDILTSLVRALAWLVAKRYLDIKIAVVMDRYGQPVDYETAEKRGIFHQKVGIFEDKDGNFISFSGSVNETATAWSCLAEIL